MRQANCVVCGSEFMSRHWRGGVYTQTCSRNCSKRRVNAKRYGTVPKPPVVSFDCAQCGLTCVPGVDVAPHASKFCSQTCKSRWHRPPPLTSKQLKHREASVRLARSLRLGPPRKWIAGPCSECGFIFTSALNRGDKNAINRYCSARCSGRVMHRTRRHRLREAATGEPVRFHEIAERDGWECQLCGLPVVRDAVVPHFDAPVLDHVKSLANGGSHDPANVQLAHFICNSYKGNEERAVAS